MVASGILRWACVALLACCGGQAVRQIEAKSTGSSTPPSAAERPPLSGRATYFFDTERTDFLSDAAWSPDGTALAAERRDATFGVFEVPSGELRFTGLSPGEVLSIGFAADGSFVWVVATHGAAKYDAKNGTCLGIVEVASSRGHTHAAWSRDGHHLVVVGDDGILRGIAGSTLEERWHDDGAELRSIDLSPAGDRIIAYGANGYSERDARTGERLGNVAEAKPGFSRVDISPDGSAVVSLSTDWNVLRVEDALTGTVRAEIAMQGTVYERVDDSQDAPLTRKAKVLGLTFTADGKHLAVTHELSGSLVIPRDLRRGNEVPSSRLMLVDVATGAIERRFDQPIAGFLRFARSDSVAVVYTSSNRAETMGARSASEMGIELRSGRTIDLVGVEGELEPSTESPTGQLVAQFKWGGPRVVDAATSELKFHVEGVSGDFDREGEVLQPALDPQRVRVALAGTLGGGFIGIWEPVAGFHALHRNIDPPHIMWGSLHRRPLAWTAFGLALIAEPYGEKYELFDSSLALRGRLENATQGLFVNRTAERLIGAGVGTLDAYDATSLARTGGDTSDKRVPRDGAFSLDGSMVAFIDDYGRVDAYEPATFRRLSSFATKGGRVRFLKDGRLVVVGTLTNLVSIYEVGAGTRLAEFTLPAPPSERTGGQELAWSADGATLILEDGRVWDLADNRARLRLARPVTAALFAEGGSRFAATHDGVRWSVYASTDAAVVGSAMARRGEHIESISADGEVLLFSSDRGARLLRIGTGRSLEIALFGVGGTVDPIFVLDTGHFQAPAVVASHLRLVTARGVLRGDDAAEFARDAVGLDF